MFWKLYEIVFAGAAMQYLKFWISDNPAVTEGCDACISYAVFDSVTRKEIDGGEMDYDSEAKAYQNLEDALDDLIDFIWDGKKPVSCAVSSFDADLLEDA